MGIFSWVPKLWADIKKAFTSIQVDGLKIAIAITGDINTALKSGIVQDLVKALDPNPEHLPAEILTAAQNIIPKVLAAELGLQALIQNPTPDQQAAFATEVLTAFGVKNALQKGKIYTNLATELTILFKQTEASNNSWGGWAAAVEQGYEDVQAVLTNSNATVSA
jgi:hypothetical protein